MAYDKIVDSGALDTKLTAIADAIRGKTGKTEEMTLDQMVTEIAGIQIGGGGDTTIWRNIIDRSISGEFSDSELTAVGSYAFNACKNLTKVNLPKAKLVQSRAFMDCTNLQEIYLPEYTEDSAASALQGGYAFSGCTNLTKAYVPKMANLRIYAFRNCSSLQEIDLPSVASMSTVFEGCTSLKTIVFRKSDAIVPLGNVGCFRSTPFAEGGTGGTVYVPQALIESYQTATNWSTLYAAGTCNFVAIEGSEYE